MTRSMLAPNRSDVEIKRFLRLDNADINHKHEKRHVCIVDQDFETEQFADADCDTEFWLHVKSENFNVERSELRHFDEIASDCVNVHINFVKDYCKSNVDIIIWAVNDKNC